MIDLSPKLNPARLPAIQFAISRANRESRPMCVYVGPPNASQILDASGFNVWYVRPEGDIAPEGAELFQTVFPENNS